MAAPTVYERQAAVSATSSTSTSVTATLGSTPASGSVLFAAVLSTCAKGTASMTGWTLGIEAALSTNAHSLGLWYKMADGTESTSVTASFGGTNRTYNAIVVHEYSGVLRAGLTPFSQLAENQASGSSYSINANVGATTSRWPPSIIVSAIGLNNGNTGGSWSCNDSQSANATCYSSVAQNRLCTAASVGPEYADFSGNWYRTHSWSWSTSRPFGSVSLSLPMAEQVFGEGMVGQ